MGWARRVGVGLAVMLGTSTVGWVHAQRAQLMERAAAGFCPPQSCTERLRLRAGLDRVAVVAIAYDGGRNTAYVVELRRGSLRLTFRAGSDGTACAYDGLVGTTYVPRSLTAVDLDGDGQDEVMLVAQDTVEDSVLVCHLAREPRCIGPLPIPRSRRRPSAPGDGTLRVGGRTIDVRF